MNSSGEAFMVSLWDMLSLLSIASTVGGAAGGAVLAGGGGARLGLGLALGLGLGVLFTWGLRKTGERVFRSIPDEDPSASPPAQTPPHLRGGVRLGAAPRAAARPLDCTRPHPRRAPLSGRPAHHGATTPLKDTTIHSPWEYSSTSRPSRTNTLPRRRRPRTASRIGSCTHPDTRRPRPHRADCRHTRRPNWNRHKRSRTSMHTDSTAASACFSSCALQGRMPAEHETPDTAATNRVHGAPCPWDARRP